MSRLRRLLKWDAMQDFGWAVTAKGDVFYVRRKHFRRPPTAPLRDGMAVKFSKPMINADFLERLFAGKERDTFSGSHRNPRPKPDSRKKPLANDSVILEEGGPQRRSLATTPTAQQVPPIIPREQPGLGPASLGPDKETGNLASST